MQCKDSATVRSERNEPSASERPRHVPNFNFLFSCFSPLISSHQHQNRPLPLNHQRNISANKCPPFPPSHPLLSSPSLLPLPLSTFGKRRSSLAAARQLYALVETSILSILHSANDFLSFFCTFGAVLMLQIALADSGLSIGMVYVFIVGVLLVKEGIASNSEYVLLLFSRFCVIHSRTHCQPVSARYVFLYDYGLVTVGPLSKRPLSPLVLSFISLLSFSLDDVAISRP
jgi:hypothetical protein